MDLLMTSLLDLLFELGDQATPLTVGGGFGLFLKQQQLLGAGERTLFDRLPEARSTNDLDLFIRVEVLADMQRTRQFADAISRLGYQVVEDAKYLQWKRPVRLAEFEQEVKIDLLVGPLGNLRSRLNIKSPRARPKGDIKFHAHMVEEALSVEEAPTAILVTGRLSNGNPHQATVQVPHAFPYLMMKLHAFKDRKEDENKDLGRHHALDLYTIVGLMTEREYAETLELGKKHTADPHVLNAQRIVRDHFGTQTGVGLLRIREHRLCRPDFLLADFIAVLGEVFQS